MSFYLSTKLKHNIYICTWRKNTRKEFTKPWSLSLNDHSAALEWSWWAASRLASFLRSPQSMSPFLQPLEDMVQVLIVDS